LFGGTTSIFKEMRYPHAIGCQQTFAKHWNIDLRRETPRKLRWLAAPGFAGAKPWFRRAFAIVVPFQQSK
jgi:hypothetical protein